MKKVIFLVSMILTIGVCGMYTVNAQDYYVSNSQGSDTNDGMSEETPWKTLKKVSSVVFNAGDNIYLKAGDEWEETLFAKGEGNSENWITLTSYGEGAKPKISPKHNATYGIFLDNYGGWKFTGLEVSHAQAGIRMLMSENPQIEHDGLWFEDLYVHDIYNAPQTPNEKEPGLYMSYGISTFKVLGRGLPAITNVTFKNCLIENTDAPATLASINGLYIENVTMRNNFKEGILFSQINEDLSYTGYMKNCKVFYSGTPKGMYWGTAGVQFNSTRNFLMEGCEVAYTKAPGNPDGCGLDFEGTCKNITLKNNYFHDNDGVAIMVYKNPGWGQDNEDLYIIDNVCENNGLKNTKGEQSFLRHKYNTETKVYLEGNKIKVFEGQPAISIEEAPLEIKVENGEYIGDWPTESYEGKNNTIEIVPLGEYANYSVISAPIDTKIVKEWTFDNNTTEGFISKQSLTSLEAENGAIHADITARDPYLMSPDNLNIDMNKNTVIHIRMKQTTSRPKAEIFFTTTEATTWTSGQYKGFYLKESDDYVDYYVDMQYIDNWKGTLKQLRIDPIDNANGVLGEVSIDYISIGENLNGVREVPTENIDNKPITILSYVGGAKHGVTKEYGWDFETGTEGWKANPNGAIGTVKAEGGILKGDIIARDPYLLSADNLGYDINDIQFVGIKFKNDTARSSAKVYFATEDEPDFSDDKSVNVSIAAYDTAQRLYVADMSKNEKWKGKLKRLRFDPIDNADKAYGTFEIEYIYLGNAGEEIIPKYVPADIFGHWAYDAMNYMMECGAVTVENGELYSPEKLITREDAAVMIARAFKLKKETYNNAFSDVSSSRATADDIQRVLKAGIMQGDGNKFYPEAVLSRQEAAEIIKNIMKSLDKNTEYNGEALTFTDSDKIAAWAKGSIAVAKAAGIISGMPDGSFMPEGTLTKAQISSLIFKTIEWNRKN